MQRTTSEAEKIIRIDKYVGAVVGLMLTTAFCFAQATKFTGFVKNASLQPVQSASVMAKQNGVIKAFNYTNAAGQFSMILSAKDTYVLEITSVGFNKLSQTIVTDSSKNDESYILTINPKAEDTIHITAQNSIYEKNDTVFYNTDAFKRNNENNLKDLLNNLPGISVLGNGKIVADGQVVDKLLIDGRDLTGDDYEKIVNNLSPHGLDQIQVLKKYKDPFDIASSATNTTEVAINLTFKNKKVIPNAKLSLSMGAPFHYYEQKSDFLVLTKPVTAVNFINANTTGNTFQLITSPNSLFTVSKPTTFKKLGKEITFKNDIQETFLQIPKNYYSFNRTLFIDNSSQFNIGKKVTNKLAINYTPEKIKQFENSTSTSFLGSQIFAETESKDEPHIMRNTFTVKNELIWMIQKKAQLKLLTNFSTEHKNANTDNILNSNSVKFDTKNNRRLSNYLLNYTTYLRRNTIYNSVLFLEEVNSGEALTNTGILYVNTIIQGTGDIINFLSQKYSIKERNWGYYSKFIFRKNDYSVTLQPTYKNINGAVISTVDAVTTSNTSFTNIDSFSNNYIYVQRLFGIPMSYKIDKYKKTFTIALEPLYFFNTRLHTLVKKPIIDWNGSINYMKEFGGKRRLTLQASRIVDYSFFHKMTQKNMIINNKNKLQNPSTFLNDKSYYVSINSSKSGTFSNKLNLGHSLNARFSRPNYLNNNVANNNYSIVNFIFNTVQNIQSSYSLRTNFTFKSILRIENDFTLSASKLTNAQNSNVVKVNSQQRQVATRVFSTFTGMVNFTFNNVTAYQTNQRAKSGIRNKSLQNTINAALNINYKKKSHLDIEYYNFHVNTFSNPKQSISILHLSYKQLINNNKIRLGLDVRNVTNQNKYRTQTLSITQYTESSVQLLPGYALFKIEFLL